MLDRHSLTSFKNFLKHFRIRCGGQRGFGLMEVMVSVGILGTAAFMMVSSLSSGMLFVRMYQERVYAENIARTQMALVRSPLQQFVPGAESYVPQGDTEDYDVSIIVTEIDPILTNEIQKITVNVYHAGKKVYTLEGLKANS